MSATGSVEGRGRWSRRWGWRFGVVVIFRHCLTSVCGDEKGKVSHEDEGDVRVERCSLVHVHCLWIAVLCLPVAHEDGWEQ